MRALIHSIFFLIISFLSCSTLTCNNTLPTSETLSPCPLDTCQKTAIELSLQGYNYSASFTCYEWTDWEQAWKSIGKMEEEYCFSLSQIIVFAMLNFVFAPNTFVIAIGYQSKVVREIIR